MTLDPSTVTALIAAGSAVLGACGKALWGARRQKDTDSATVAISRIDDGAAIRKELWEEIEKLRARIDLMQEDLDKSRLSYLELLAQHTTLKSEHMSLKHEHDKLQILYAALENRVEGGTV